MKNEKTPESPRDKKERKKFSPKKLLAITLAAGSLALPLAGCGDKAVDASPTPNPDKTELPSSPTPGASQSASPEASPSPTETAEAIPTVESLEVDKSLLNEPEKLVQVFDRERIVEWTNSGATLENVDAAYNSDLDIPEFAAKIAAKYDEVYIKALFLEGWEDTPAAPALAAYIDKIKKSHADTLALYFYTASTASVEADPKDKEPYRYDMITTLDKVVLEKPDYISVYKTCINDDNSEMNRAGEDLTGGKDSTSTGAKMLTTYQIENGSIKISKQTIVNLIN